MRGVLADAPIVLAVSLLGYMIAGSSALAPLGVWVVVRAPRLTRQAVINAPAV